MQNILINASNLHVGGGVQVAVSTISEMAGRRIEDSELNFAISREVAQNLGARTLENYGTIALTELDVNGFDPFNFQFRKMINQYDKVFTIFGPLYRWRIRGQSIVGFAQPWIIFPNNEVYDMLPLFQRIKTRLKFFIQKQFYKRADILVVELDHVKDGLIRELGVDPDRIHVIKNCVSSIYSAPENWIPLAMPDSGATLRLGFLGRNYFHKNTAIFPKIALYLREEHNINAKFYVTFSQDEWEACTPDFRAACINVGPISVGQCPNFYRNLDAVVFPSLLECFSATPLEAMAMGRPLFASDRQFNRDICQEYAQYFDPNSPKEAAKLIAKMVLLGGADEAFLMAARDHALTFSSPLERVNEYLSLISAGTSQ